MTSPSSDTVRCTVTGTENLPAEVGGADRVCEAIQSAIVAEAAEEAAGASVLVRVVSPYAIVATVTAPGGRELPPVEVSIADRTLNSRSLQMLAVAVARQVAASQ
jgi:hypothetical protein